jgi:hypothetical protein
MDKVPLLVPDAVGTKPTKMMQLFPGKIGPEQFAVAVKSPEAVIWVMVNAAVFPMFSTVTRCRVLATPIWVEPKVSDDGLTLTCVIGIALPVRLTV